MKQKYETSSREDSTRWDLSASHLVISRSSVFLSLSCMYIDVVPLSLFRDERVRVSTQ